MNIHNEFEAFLKKKKLTLNRDQRLTANLFLNANDSNPIWLRARASGVTTLLNALEEFYKYHQPTTRPERPTELAGTRGSESANILYVLERFHHCMSTMGPYNHCAFCGSSLPSHEPDCQRAKAVADAKMATIK